MNPLHQPVACYGLIHYKQPAKHIHTCFHSSKYENLKFNITYQHNSISLTKIFVLANTCTFRSSMSRYPGCEIHVQCWSHRPSRVHSIDERITTGQRKVWWWFESFQIQSTGSNTFIPFSYSRRSDRIKRPRT